MPPYDPAYEKDQSQESDARREELYHDQREAHLAESGQEKPKEMKEQEQQQAESRMQGLTPSSEKLPTLKIDHAQSNLEDDAHEIRASNGADKDRVHKALEGKTPEEIAELRRIYKQKFDKDLETELRENMSQEEVDNLLRPRHEQQATGRGAGQQPRSGRAE